MINGLLKNSIKVDELSGKEFVWLSIGRTSKPIHCDLNFGSLRYHHPKVIVKKR